MPTNPTSRRPLRLVTVLLLVTATLLFAIEGVSSFAVTAIRLWSYRPGVGPHHLASKFDPEIGWIGAPNVYNRDHFGKGVYVKTDSHGYRSNYEVSNEIPSGKLRVVCSGDSFTFGSRVDNEHTWCALLARLNPTLETVNLGQIGYGVDQAYLWYKRNAPQLKHNVHLFAFIGDDFRRMAVPTFSRFNKPVLSVDHGKIIEHNVPVHDGSLQRRLAPLEELRTLELIKRLTMRLTGGEANAMKGEEKARGVALRIFEDLQQIIERQAGHLVLVYLPEIDDCRVDTGIGTYAEMEPYYKMLPGRRAFLKKEAERMGVSFFDLTGDFCSLGPQVEAFYQREPLPTPLIGRLGHYSDAGNQFAAERIAEKLARLPWFASAVEQLHKTSRDSHIAGQQHAAPAARQQVRSSVPPSASTPPPGEDTAGNSGRSHAYPGKEFHHEDRPESLFPEKAAH
jgi:hypothetical protein